MLDVSRTPSFDVTLVRLSVCLPVCLFVGPSVTKFSQNWIIIFLILYMMIADHDI